MTYETIAQKIKSIPQNHLPEIENLLNICCIDIQIREQPMIKITQRLFRIKSLFLILPGIFILTKTMSPVAES